MSSNARLTLRDNPETSFSLREDGQFVFGRSQECDFQIPDSFVSRRQAKIYYESGRYVLENIGSNPIFVNGSKAAKRFLEDGDKITFGKTNLVFQLLEPELEISAKLQEDMPESDETVLAVRSKELGPRLVVTALDGKDMTHPLHGPETVIGRLAEADIRLDDPSVSRKHCVIEWRDNRFFVNNLSETNPTAVNTQPVTKKALYSGDQIRIGVFAVSFLSDRPEDARPAEERIVYKGKGLFIGASLVVCAAILALGGFISYSQFYTPWKIRNSLKAASQQIDSGSFQPAHETLKTLLAMQLPPKELQIAMDLFSKTTLFEAKKMAEAGKIKEARDYLISYLNNYKTGKEAKTIRNQVDAYRFRLAQDLESSGDQLAALQEYSNISEESTYTDQARQAISGIWFSSQQKELSLQPIDRLMIEAEENFSAKKYTTPFNNNAYVIFRTILSLDPDNAVALQRINQMKLFYRENGDKYFQQKSYASALSYYERYVLIDPQDAGINEKMTACRRNLAGRHSPTQPTKTGEGQDGQEDRVKRLIDGSGTN